MAEEKDPLQGNTGATKERLAELKQLNVEGAKTKAMLQGLAGAFKNFDGDLKSAVKNNELLAGSAKNLSTSYKSNIGLAKQLSGVTVSQLKDAKSRATFEKQVLKAQGEQASIASEISILQGELTELSQLDLQLEGDRSKAVREREAAQAAAAAQEKEARKVTIAQEKEITRLSELSTKAYAQRTGVIDEAKKLEAEIAALNAKGESADKIKIADLSKQLELKQREADNITRTLDDIPFQKNAAEEAILDAQILLEEKQKALLNARLQYKVTSDLAAEVGNQIGLTKELIKTNEKAADAIENGLNHAQGLSARIEEINNATPKFIQAFEKFGELVAPIPIVGDVIRQITGDISKSAEMFKKAKAEGKSTFKAWGTAATGFLKLGVFAAAAKFISLIVDGAKNSSKAIVTLNKSVAGSNVNMAAQMGRVSSAASKLKVPLQEAAATIGGINEALGMQLDYTQETTNQAIKLTNKYGLGVDTTAKLVKLSAANKDTMTETVDAITAGVAQFNAMNGVSISTKAIFDDIAHASATTLNGIGKQPGAIAAAAAAARSLGMSMEDIRSAAESTTDFQASLTSEMQTEMMLGKQLNLNKLREAALSGDVKTQAEEMQRLVRENAGRIGNNVKLQEQFASTLGISRDQYNEMLKTQDAMSVLTGKSGAAESANAKNRKMTQEEIAKSVDATTGKLTDLTSRIEKFQENMALGSFSFAKQLFNDIKEGDWKGAWNTLWDGLTMSWEDFKSGSQVGKFLGAISIAGGGLFLTLKAGNWIGKLLGFGKMNKNTYTADGRLRVDGGGLGDMGQQTDADMASSSLGNSLFRGNMFKYLGNKGGLSRTLNRGFIKMFGNTRFTKFMQTKVFNVLGKNSTMLGRAMNNLFAKVIPNSAKNLTKTFGTNNMSKILNQARGGNVKALSKVKQFVKPQFLKSALSKGMDPKVANTLLKSTTNLSKGARVMTSLGKIFTKGNIAAIAGGLIVDKIASSSKEKADKSFTDAANIQTSNVIGFNANVSDLSDKIGLLNESAKARGIEKAAGVGSAALTGAGIGSMVGSIIPGIGTAIGGAVGGVIGAGVGLYQQYFSKEAKENAQLEKQARADMLGITLEEEKLLRKRGVEEAVNLRLEEAAQAKEAASQMLQMDLASFAQMTAEEQNRHVTKLNLSEQMMEELNNNIGTATQDLSKVINEEAQKIEDNSFVGKTKKFFSNLFGSGDKENVTKIEQTIDSTPIIKAASSDAQKIRNSVGASEKTIAAAVAASESRAQNIANQQASQQNKDQTAQMRELQNQTALLYQYIARPQKSVIKMNTFKVGETLTVV